MRTDAGQAMIECALGMLVFALVLSALLAFGRIIPESLRLQGLVRRLAGREAQATAEGGVDGAPPAAFGATLDEPEVQPLAAAPFRDQLARPLVSRQQTLSFEVDISAFAADWLFGARTFKGHESVYMPAMALPEGAGDVEGFAP